jgi:hypothetical protein
MVTDFTAQEMIKRIARGIELTRKQFAKPTSKVTASNATRGPTSSATAKHKSRGSGARKG